MLMARRVGSWQLDPVPIGSGSFAIVWKAWHVDTGVMAAVKEITTDRLSPKLLESLQSEIAVLRRTQHRNIVTMLDLIQVLPTCTCSACRLGAHACSMQPGLSGNCMHSCLRQTDGSQHIWRRGE